ncbi:Cilia- and flagella-associated protein 206 like protein [Aduncisulcus paluster]|uniref:Cilia- and flagella-associated protein 206 n=1 Tax=Aduncisulcus paluster TaxID=2918883 RepID=A0ABQ5KTR1_9EUKA|nr:Cilia- and flagella-associated protein 206 like protein [Aduncisulcus paluster]
MKPIPGLVSQVVNECRIARWPVSEHLAEFVCRSVLINSFRQIKPDKPLSSETFEQITEYCKTILLAPGDPVPYTLRMLSDYSQSLTDYFEQIRDLRGKRRRDCNLAMIDLRDLHVNTQVFERLVDFCKSTHIIATIAHPSDLKTAADSAILASDTASALASVLPQEQILIFKQSIDSDDQNPAWEQLNDLCEIVHGIRFLNAPPTAELDGMMATINSNLAKLNSTISDLKREYDEFYTPIIIKYLHSHGIGDSADSSTVDAALLRLSKALIKESNNRFILRLLLTRYQVIFAEITLQMGNTLTEFKKAQITVENFVTGKSIIAKNQIFPHFSHVASLYDTIAICCSAAAILQSGIVGLMSYLDDSKYSIRYIYEKRRPKPIHGSSVVRQAFLDEKEKREKKQTTSLPSDSSSLSLPPICSGFGLSLIESLDAINDLTWIRTLQEKESELEKKRLRGVAKEGSRDIASTTLEVLNDVSWLHELQQYKALSPEQNMFFPRFMGNSDLSTIVGMSLSRPGFLREMKEYSFDSSISAPAPKNPETLCSPTLSNPTLPFVPYSQPSHTYTHSIVLPTSLPSISVFDTQMSKDSFLTDTIGVVASLISLPLASPAHLPLALCGIGDLVQGIVEHKIYESPSWGSGLTSRRGFPCLFNHPPSSAEARCSCAPAPSAIPSATSANQVDVAGPDPVEANEYDSGEYVAGHGFSRIKTLSFLTDYSAMCQCSVFGKANDYYADYLANLFEPLELLDIQGRKSDAIVEFGIQTPIHFVEKHIDTKYTSSEWELRKLAIHLTNITHKRTHAVQTDRSHFKRDEFVEALPPKDSSTQTPVDSGTSTKRVIRRVAGLSVSQSGHATMKRSQFVVKNLVAELDL